jgi:hypothetical protein
MQWYRELRSSNNASLADLGRWLAAGYDQDLTQRFLSVSLQQFVTPSASFLNEAV